jgi:hypothetical protein
VNEPKESSTQDLVDAERVRLDEKTQALAMALEERIKQHRFERERCDLRIEKCFELMKKPGAIKADLEILVKRWQRIREHHIEVRQSAERILREISGA